MAHLMKHTGRPEPGVWRAAAPERVREWRERAHKNLMNNDGRAVTFEDITAHHMDWPDADVDDAGNPVMEKPASEKPRQGREVVEMVSKDLVDQMLWWAKHDPELFRKKVRLMKQTSGMSHLTDDQAAEQVHGLCRKIAEAEVAEVHETTGVAGKHFYQGAVLLD